MLVDKTTLTYRDESVLPTSLVAAAWRLSHVVITDWLARYDTVANALGYDQFDSAGQGRTIGPAQYSRRLRALGLLPYFLIFIALAMASLCLGIAKGWAHSWTLIISFFSTPRKEICLLRELVVQF